MKKLLSMMKRLLREGLSPEKVALAVALGLTIGVFPIYSPMSLVILFLAWVMKLNKPLALAAYYAMTFVMPVLILPFLRLGEWLSRAEPVSINLIELSKSFASAPMETLHQFGWSFAHAILGWITMAPVLVLVLFTLVRYLGVRWQKRGNEIEHIDEDDATVPVQSL